MTVDEINARVDKIEAEMRDYEAAHGDEDKLHVDVLRAIAEGAPNAAELARAALRTTSLDFARYCA
jgi:hypothetical protein